MPRSTIGSVHSEFGCHAAQLRIRCSVHLETPMPRSTIFIIRCSASEIVTVGVCPDALVSRKGSGCVCSQNAGVKYPRLSPRFCISLGQIGVSKRKSELSNLRRTKFVYSRAYSTIRDREHNPCTMWARIVGFSHPFFPMDGKTMGMHS